MAGKAKSRTVSEAVAGLAAEIEMDQVVVIGWNSKTERYVMVAHGRNALEQQDADAFAERLLSGIGAPTDRIDYARKKAKQG
jgi:hypothetical protein